MRQYALVQFVEGEKDQYDESLHKDMPLIFFGEIPNKPGHGIFMSVRRKKFYLDLHIESFEEIDEDDVL